MMKSAPTTCILALGFEGISSGWNDVDRDGKYPNNNFVFLIEINRWRLM